MSVPRSTPAAVARWSHVLDCSGVRTGMVEAIGLLITLPYRPPKADFSVVDPKIESTVGVGAHPGFVGDRGPFTAVVGKRYQCSLRALLTGWPLLGFHVPSPLT